MNMEDYHRSPSAHSLRKNSTLHLIFGVAQRFTAAMNQSFERQL
jgi:hypothetical protein